MITSSSNNAPLAMLFDLDGTLIDSAPDLASAVDATLVDLGLSPVGIESTRRWVGNGARNLVVRALSAARHIDEAHLPEDELDTAMTYFFAHYQRCCHEQSALYDGVMSALRGWQQQGIRLACVTNKPARFTAPVLAHFGLSALFGAVISGDTLAVKKPDPAPLLLACEQLGVQVDQALMVGDSVNDVLAARAAGMPVACVDYGYNHGEPIANTNPDWLVSSLVDLLV